MNCPKCQAECDRDEVDIGVGIQYGPYGCQACGWSEDPRFDGSEGPSPAQRESPGYYVDSRGGRYSLSRIEDKLERFGLPRDLATEVFSPKPSKEEKHED